VKPRNETPAWNGLRECRECRAVGQSAKAMSASKFWNISVSESPGSERMACQEGMCSESSEPLAGSPRRSRTAKASRISRRAVKSRCAREWGGWGRLSDDGPGHYNPDPSEGPWGRWSSPPHGGAVIASTDPTLCGSTLKHEGRRQTGRRSAYAGSRLKLIDTSGRSRLTRQPFSRTEGKPAVRCARISPEEGDEKVI
jgi:hypothetical protein